MKWFKNLKQKITAKIDKFKADSVAAYMDYQVMCSQPTITEPFNDSWTRIRKQENVILTCCCNEIVTEPADKSNATCPKCGKNVLFEECKASE